MKSRIAFIILVCLALARPAVSQNRVDLFTDTARTNCTLLDTGIEVEKVYVFLAGSAVSTGVRFIAPRPACWTGATWIADTPAPDNVAIGNSQTGWDVAFGGFSTCKTPPVFVGTINYFAGGAVVHCCDMIASQPAAFLYGYLDCSYAPHPVESGQKVVINPDTSCPCAFPLATESSTWGRVKSLYR